MNPFQIFFLFFLSVPFFEIYMLLKMGGIIGAFPTILLVVFTAVLGAWMLRQQGFATWQRLQAGMAKGQPPVLAMIEGPILLVGGALLLTPGFFTDIIGFLCLVPITRKKMALYLIEKNWMKTTGSNPFRQHAKKPKNIIEGEYKKEDD